MKTESWDGRRKDFCFTIYRNQLFGDIHVHILRLNATPLYENIKWQKIEEIVSINDFPSSGISVASHVAHFPGNFQCQVYWVILSDKEINVFFQAFSKL